MLHGESRLGARSEYAVGAMVATLRRMLNFAKEHGWVKVSIFQRGTSVTPDRPTFRSNRIMTIEEEQRLLAACVGEFSYLRASLIYMADIPAYQLDYLRLLWRDVDFENRLIVGRRGFVEMTPRLFEAMRALWESSEHHPRSRIVSRSKHQHNKDFYKVRAAAGIQGLRLSDIRRTGAWRMKKAGRQIEQIAAALGISHLDHVREFLAINHPTALEEEASPRFKEFLSEQFGIVVNGNGPGEKKLARRARKLLEVVNAIIAVWGDVKNPNLPHEEQIDMVRQWRVAGKLDIGDPKDKTAAANQVGEKLRRLGLRDIFPETAEPYRTLVETVIGDTERGIAPETIVSALFRRLT